MGNSLGTGVAVELARRAQPAALVLRSAFSSIGDVGQAAYPFFPVRPFLRDRFDSASKIAEIGCPLLCVHGADDDIIPARFGRALFDKAAEPKRWLAIPGAGHNDLESVAGETYWNAVAAFLDEHVVR
jgi:fermentation-respiration switch protein FrsA (DUF1100 family)